MMKANLVTRRSLGIGLAFGGLTMSTALRAQDLPKPGFLLVVGKTTDRARIGNYAASLPPIYAANNAYYLAIGGAGRGVRWLEGPWTDRSIIFAKFPSRAGVDSFWWGEPYRAAIRRRDNAGVFSVVAQEALAPMAFEGSDAGYLIVMTGRRDNSPAQVLASDQASHALINGVTASGGIMLTSNEIGSFTSMEGDTLFDRICVAGWPTKAARDAYVGSRQGRSATRLRGRLGVSAVAAADGVPRAQAPPAATPSSSETPR
jgi:uncharacterized protein (DUF1330 family)